MLLIKSGEGFGKIDQLDVLSSEVLDWVFALRSEGIWPLRGGPRTALH